MNMVRIEIWPQKFRIGRLEAKTHFSLRKCDQARCSIPLEIWAKENYQKQKRPGRNQRYSIIDIDFIPKPYHPQEQCISHRYDRFIPFVSARIDKKLQEKSKACHKSV